MGIIRSRKQKEIKKVSYDQLDKIIQQELQGGPDKVMTHLPPPEGWDQTDSVLVECEGWWWLHSNSNPKWHAEGKAIVGGKEMCKEAKHALSEMWRVYGRKNHPFDLVYRFEPLNLRKFRLVGENKPL
jgi:hypothetical protein